MSKITKNKFLRDPQNIIAVGVTIISLCALIVSAIQTSVLIEERELIREYSRASVWPHLEFGLGKGHNKNDGSIDRFSFNLTNNGVGPAIVTDVKVTCNDSIAQNWWDLFKIVEIHDSIDTHINNRRFNGQVIKLGETVEVLNLDDNIPLANAFYRQLQAKGFSIEIYYESIYGEKWKNFNGTVIKLDNFEGLPKEEQFN